MKRLKTSLLVAIFIPTIFFAQDVLKVKKDMEKAEFPIENLHKLTFNGDSFYLHLRDGSITPFSFNSLKDLTFGESTGASIKEQTLNSQDIGLFPNPVCNYLNFHIKTTADIKLTIINLQGEIVLSKQGLLQDEQLDVSFLESGIYLIYIQIEDKNSTKIFIKN